jgi:hypothetical protein
MIGEGCLVGFGVGWVLVMTMGLMADLLAKQTEASFVFPSREEDVTHLAGRNLGIGICGWLRLWQCSFKH